MGKKPVLDIIYSFRKVLESKKIRINKLILFGSYANGKHKESSDIDLVVISKDFNGKNYWERIDILSAAIYEIFEPIEAVAMTPQEWRRRESCIFDYAKSGRVICQ